MTSREEIHQYASPEMVKEASGKYFGVVDLVRAGSQMDIMVVRLVSERSPHMTLNIWCVFLALEWVFKINM